MKGSSCRERAELGAPPVAPLEGWTGEHEEEEEEEEEEEVEVVEEEDDDGGEGEEEVGVEELVSFAAAAIPGRILAGPEGGGHPALPRGAEPGPPSSDRGGDLPAR